ncbi:MAG TPA: hypothetical protein VHW04_05970 [Solirubrobacteraceae bacterium]|nr:hypothetical protein [Solirubrobacteraceae bacterium]
MTTAAAPVPAEHAAATQRLRRLAPTLVAALFAAVYVIVSPASLDLADHLFRAQLFRDEGFGLWNNLWYGGHHIVGYSVLFPAVSALLSPQLAGALAATGTAALFEPLARRHFGPDAWLGAVLFGAATAIDLYTGRLAFAFGALPALGAIVALDRGATPLACGLAVLSALCSPVAALFAALIAAGYALGGLLRAGRLTAALPGVSMAAGALVPIALLAVAFPEGGSEPFGFPTMFPVLVIVALALLTTPRSAVTLRAGLVIYALATIVVYLVDSPIGSNIARLGTFLAAPMAALLWYRRRPVLLALATLPLLYVGWAAPVRDVVSASNDESATTGYYQPVLRFLRRESAAPEPPFRTEIPFTRFHWEAWVVAAHFPLARGWERQLDIADNPLFYSGRLTAAKYDRWLHDNAIRFVAAPDAPLDYSAQGEKALIDRGLPYLHLVMHSAHWRVYAVAHPTPIASGVATLVDLGPDWLTLRARRPGEVRLHVRFTPYWKLSRGSGCVAPDGPWTRLTLDKAGPVKLTTDFSLARIRATSPRCTSRSIPN